MRSPLGPVLADIFMTNLERTKLKRAIDEMTYYSRCVDDTFIVCNNKQHAINLLEFFNEAHPNIHFTMEHEKENMFHFLDIAIKRRKDGTVQRSVYKKDTWNGSYLNFNSFCPINYKKALVKTLFHRTERICTADTIEEEVMNVKKCLTNNGYPLKFIEKYGKHEDKKPKEITANKKPIFIQLQFKGDDVTGSINMRLKTALTRTYPAAKLIVLSITTCSLTQSRVDRYPFHVTTNCVYKFTCICQSSYIGRTERRAYVRFKEHIPKSLRLNGLRASSSAIARHLLNTGHEVDTLKSLKVVNKQSNSNLLKFAEAIAIKRLKPDLCIQKRQ
ncbi:unnamed protein product [Schistosoma haematobium]|nr:unnamed protein product [Schistosoma haematobium]CAH8590665.1 unnamed protein product [Schistosoma haematobium]